MSICTTAPRALPGFADHLAPHFSLHHLESHSGSVFGLLPDGTIAYVNPAFVRFAHDNGAKVDDPVRPFLGARYFDVIAEPLRSFYRELMASAPVAGRAARPVAHVYECSSADTFRQFAMHLYVMGEGAGYIVINTLVESRPHDAQRLPASPDPTLYTNKDGIIVQCAHCRLVRRSDGSRWDWVPDYIRQTPANVSHGVCEVCLEYYFPEQD